MASQGVSCVGSLGAGSERHWYVASQGGRLVLSVSAPCSAPGSDGAGSDDLILHAKSHFSKVSDESCLGESWLLVGRQTSG